MNHAVSLPPIVSADWVLDRMSRSPTELAIADVRSYLDGRDGHQAFLDRHLPGAVFVDLDRVLAAPASPDAGRHPLPSPEVFARGLAAAGIGDDRPVVAYDDLGGMMAGRLVWMLRILGSPAALLDGGLTAWPGPTESGPSEVEPVERRARPWPSEATASISEVEQHVAAGGLVVDSRAPERYRGETEPIDPRAGHIPGAVNAPFAANLDDDGRFLPPEELADRFDGLGADERAIFYCGSGVSACHNLLAMEAAGRPLPRLYVGSWSQWSSDPDRPAATGADP